MNTSATVAELHASLALARAGLAAAAEEHLRLLEAEETLRAIRNGEVDALVVSTSGPAQRVYTLSSADRPYRIFVENMQEGAATVSASGVVLFANDRLGVLLGCPASDLVAQPISGYLDEKSQAWLLAVSAPDDATRNGATLEVRLVRPDGRLVGALLGVSQLDVDGEIVSCLTFTDLSAEHALLQEVRQSEERYRAIVENVQEGIGILDGSGHFVFVNRRIAQLLGRTTQELVGLDAFRLLGWFGTGSGQESRITRPDGTVLDLLISSAPMTEPGTGQAGALCVLSDVTGLRRAEEAIAHAALHDALTGLPNRTLLVDRIDQALVRRGTAVSGLAALYCDLDGFKDVNDSFGHHIGDEVLQVAAERLRAAMRGGDTVARLGGDEFVVLCDGFDDEPAAWELAARVLGALSEPVMIGGQELPMSVSIGVAFARSGDSAELLRNADAAMYLAKQRGRNRVELFDERLREAAAERITLIAELRHAVEREELRVYYQPVLALADERVLGVEALVRWQHPRRGLLAPGEFIPAAESAGLIGAIGAWVLKTACRQAAVWATSGTDGGPLDMAVNVSARQLAQGSGLVQLVKEALAEAEIDPGSLTLEVTESVLMDDAEAALTILTELKGLGVRLAIDDFGTGYSSLVYLKRFPIDLLKVDRTFVNGLGSDADDAAIVASVVGLAHAVGLTAIAEGVETRDQLAALQALGCAYGQGFLWSRPVPATEIEAGFLRAASSPVTELVAGGLLVAQVEGAVATPCECS